MSAIIKPEPDRAAILSALTAMFEPDDVIELRAFHKGKKRTDAGYFDGEHRDALADAAARLNAAGAAVYVTLNRLDPQMLGRYCNRVEGYANATATDANVIRRRWLLLDFDPTRPKDTSATAAQLEAAHERAQACAKTLKTEGWPDPFAGQSGNGWHLLYPLDLPNDSEARDLVKGALAGLAARFDDDVVMVDQAVFNAGRITKLFGTVANKGDHTPVAPWRLSALVSSPKRGAAVTPEQLKALHPAATAKQVAPTASYGNNSRLGDFDLSEFMARLGIAYEQDSHEGAERYKLAMCPFNSEHGKGEAAIFRQASGVLGFKCQHNSCADKHWQDVRAFVDGPKEVRRGPLANATAPARADNKDESLRAGERMAPEPLRATLPPAEVFPVQSLGTVLGGAATALHESVKAPLALCCQSVLAAASFAVQAHANVKMPWGEVKPLTLFFLTVGESGERKSAIDDLVLGAAKAQERADMAIYSEELKRYQVAVATHEHAVDAARRAATTGKKGAATQAEVMAAVEHCGEKPNAPVAPLRFVTDPTVEGLYKLLVVSQPSVALFSDEGGLLIGGHALNSDNALKTFARWCKLWDGSPFDRVRAGDGAGILYGRRMALHQLAQPDVMVKLLSDRMANGQGLLARCLVAWPATTIGTRHMEQFAWAGDLPAMRRLYAVFKGLIEATPATGDDAGQELTPFELELSPDAKALAVAASNQFESLMANGADLCELRDRTSKALENACRIAGVLAVIEDGLSVRLIEPEHLQRALVLMQWYLAEALRIRGAAAIPQSVGDAETLSAWLRDRGLKMFRTKQVLNAGPSQLRNKPRLLSAINELVTGGYLIENKPGMVVDGVSARKSWEVIHYVV